MDYFSDRENGPRPRNVEAVPDNVRKGVFSFVETLIDSGAFGSTFPEKCFDGNCIIGTNRDAFFKAVDAEIPGFSMKNNQWSFDEEDWLKQELNFFDFLEFCFRHVEKPEEWEYHSFGRHSHLSFDAKAGKVEFREYINRVFSRNHLAFELNERGQVIRMGPPVLREELAGFIFRTGDAQLDTWLEECRTKHFKPDPVLRHEALERLWDCWERLKTLQNPDDKSKSIKEILEQGAPCEKFRNQLDTEARALTKIGNEFQIRHTEVGKTPVNDPDHVDYLFSRLFSLIFMLLKKRNGSGTRGKPTTTSDDDIPF